MRPKSGKRRPERLAALIQESVAGAMATSLKDPRVGFATVTGVSVSPDGTHAMVRVSVMGTEDEKTRALEGLESARGYLRGQLARTLALRTVPELRFELDRGLQHAQRINQILADLKRDESE
ncbi:MAG: 30S ribosome-binding factor RbfA [Gemmatimonadetes bacterium]|nr:30S ribosome-binding factor RbfA [Gemmatimonadota bacterium]